MKRNNIFALSIFSLVLVIGLTGCDDNAKPTPDTNTEYTVTFDAGTGGTLTGPETVKVKEGEKVAEPTDPTRDGFSFLGWQDADSKTFDFNTAIAADITLTAGWKSAPPGVVSNVVIELDSTAMPTEFRVASYVYTDGDGTVVPNSTAEVKWLASDNSDGTSATEVATGATYSPVGVNRYKFVSASVRVKSAENIYTPEEKSTTSLFAGFSTEATRDATSTRFSGRQRHTSVRFKDKIWVIGGDGGGLKDDVWSSADGITWAQAPGPSEQNPRFSARGSHTSVDFQDSIWVIGGGILGMNDVWSSADGSNWLKKADATDQNPRFSERIGHTSVVFKDSIWVIGGITQGTQRLNDVWSSADGATWTQITNAMTGAAFSPRQEHSSVVFNNKIWVIGGVGGNGTNRFNDVWSSEDGATWTQVTPKAAFSPRNAHTSVAIDGKIWVIGGYDGTNSFNDVWSSEDGATWTQVTPKAAFSPRGSHTSVVLDYKIWVIGGGIASGESNAVWY